jgi:hypothetical protein
MTLTTWLRIGAALAAAALLWLAGSSPRTWGTLALVEPQEVRRRFIPTHVGNAA